ncbi:hypothetical protein AVL50_10090 [Flammeovirga sp. SJP92]|nr:hypothetical protein AVL50_10090 [Flammeovirga sp. SJP92]
MCEKIGVKPDRPTPNSIIGLAIDSLGNGVIHGLRHPSEQNTNGWYIWSGDYSEYEDFFKPVCKEHLNEYIKIDLEKYLDLPAGYRFLIDGNQYEDVWFDESLLEI